MMKKSFSPALLFVIILTIFLISLPRGSFAQEIKKGGTVIIALGGNPDDLNPKSYATPDSYVNNVMFEGLVNYDMRTDEMVPELANSWKFSPDGKTWTFYLQKGVKWHDGKDFSSADVAFSIKEISEKYHPLGMQAFSPISRIETPDPYTVVFKFEKPFTPASSYLSRGFSGIAPKHLYQNTDILKNPRNNKPVGTGPFMFEEFKKGSHLTVVRNPNYWRKGKPFLDKIIFRIIPDGSGRVMALEKGEVDILPPVYMPTSEMDRLKEKGFKTAAYYPRGASLSLVLMNLNDKFLGDRQVRYALAHAVNREEVIKKSYFGYARVAVGPISSALQWAFTADVPKFEHNPAKANQLLDEAGYKKGSDGIRFAIDYVYDAANTQWDRVAKIIQSQLREVGVDVRLRPLETAACIDEVFKKRNFGMHYRELTMGPDPAIAVARLYLTSQIKPVAFTNAMGYSNPEVDRLFGEAGSSTTRKSAGEKYKRIQELIVKDMPCLWIGEMPYAMAFSDKLEGLPAGPFYATDHMENVGWIK